MKNCCELIRALVVIMANLKTRYNLVRITCFPKSSSRDKSFKMNTSLEKNKSDTMDFVFAPIHSRQNCRESSLKWKKGLSNHRIFKSAKKNSSISENLGCGLRTFALSSTRFLNTRNVHPVDKKRTRKILKISLPIKQL